MEKPEKKLSIDWKKVFKFFLILAFLPVVAVWYIWEKTTWSKRNKWIATGAIVFVTVFFLAMDSSNSTNEKNKEAEALKAKVALLENNLVAERQKNVLPEAEISNELFDVVGVTDGDTIKVSLNGKIETIRLIGIDTPETVDPEKPVQCFGKESSDKAKELLIDKKVKLESDSVQGERDSYGRLLRYVFLEDGTFFNKKMIEDGFAREYNFQGNSGKYQTEFKEAEISAKNAKRGFWSPETCNGNTEKPATPIVEKIVAPEPVIVSSPVTTAPEVKTPTPVVSSGGEVKKSTTGICHAPGTTYYAKTKTFTSFSSIDACLASGGRLPKR
jgi:endonuclease YncB( thermonuclease family)